MALENFYPGVFQNIIQYLKTIAENQAATIELNRENIENSSELLTQLKELKTTVDSIKMTTDEIAISLEELNNKTTTT